MFANTCRRCGATEMTATDESRRVECAGEVVRLCDACYEELRGWLVGAPERVPEAAGRGRSLSAAPAAVTRRR